MKIALIGSSNTIFIHSYQTLLNDNGHEVKVLNSNPNYEYSLHVNYIKREVKKNKFISIIKKISYYLKLDSYDFFLNGIERKDISRDLSEADAKCLLNEVENFNPDKIICFWGTTLRKEIKALQKTSYKKTLIVNTYPTRTKFFDILDNKFLKEDKDYFSSFDHLILASRQMEKLFKDSGYLESVTYNVIPDFIYSKNIANLSNFSTKNIKNIVFLGNTDFNKRKIDDVSKEILELADYGYIVHIQPGENTLNHNNIKTFESLNFEELKSKKRFEFLSKFDAIFYGYNDVCHHRYNCSITTRFALSEGVGLPVIMKGRPPISLLSESLEVKIINYCHPKEIKELDDMSYCNNFNKNSLNQRFTEFLNTVEGN